MQSAFTWNVSKETETFSPSQGLDHETSRRDTFTSMTFQKKPQGQRWWWGGGRMGSEQGNESRENAARRQTSKFLKSLK